MGIYYVYFKNGKDEMLLIRKGEREQVIEKAQQDADSMNYGWVFDKAQAVR